MRLRATHQATVFGERVVGEDELGTDLTESDEPLLTCPARFNDRTENIVRETTGEHIEQSPSVMIPPRGYDPETGDQLESVGIVEPGMDIQIESGQWDNDETYRIDSIAISRRRGNRLESIDCQLARHD